MTRIYSYTQPLDADIVDAFCLMQKGFTDQFVYYRKDRPTRFMGLGRCIALPTLDEAECELTGPAAEQPVFFSFNRFDAHNPAPADKLFQSFPNLHFMLPEVVLIENESGAFLQVNSLGPVYAGRVERFAQGRQRLRDDMGPVRRRFALHPVAAAAAEVLDGLAPLVQPGVTTAEIDDFVYQRIRAGGGVPAPSGAWPPSRRCPRSPASRSSPSRPSTSPPRSAGSPSSG